MDFSCLHLQTGDIHICKLFGHAFGCQNHFRHRAHPTLVTHVGWSLGICLRGLYSPLFQEKPPLKKLLFLADSIKTWPLL